MPNPKIDKIWGDAIRRAVHRRMENAEGKPRKIERLAEKLVDCALAGDGWAIKEIGDRLDGRPHQTSESTVTHKTLSADPVVSENEWENDHSGQRLN